MARRTPSEASLPKRPHRVAVVAFDGVVLGDLATPCEVLACVRTSDGSPAYELRVCGAGKSVGTKHVRLSVPWPLSSTSWADTVIVPGIDHPDRHVPDTIKAAIRRVAARGARIASICSGALVLADAGVLDGMRATTHWMLAGELARRFPNVRVDADVLYIDNGQILTSAGAAAGFDLCLHLVRRDFGADVAASAARTVVMPLERAGGQAQFISYEPPNETGTPIGRVLVWIEQHLQDDLNLSALSRKAAMSTRTFCRHFREQVGSTPAAWIARARVARAQRLLEMTELSVEDIASRVGFQSSTVLREHFSRALATAPRAYRYAFART